MKNDARLAEDVHPGHSFIQLFYQDLRGLDMMLNGATETNEAQPVPGRVHCTVNGVRARTGWLSRFMFTVQPHVKNKHASEPSLGVCVCLHMCVSLHQLEPEATGDGCHFRRGHSEPPSTPPLGAGP